MEGNRLRNDTKDRAFRIQQREEDFWDEYESDFVRDSSSDESSSDGEEKEVDGQNRCEESHTLEISFAFRHCLCEQHWSSIQETACQYLRFLVVYFTRDKYRAC